ncbi:hypothetical protein [Marisediminicola sp. LYQ85]|uniref:hypothetical protein n=1 Tax=Marisediminicola sp. LYQ85 TaxID=3391062 RepID=UPI003983CA30
MTNTPPPYPAAGDDPASTRAAHADTSATPGARSTSDATLRDEVVGREKQEFGGMKFGAAFFGWLASFGAAVILTALVAGAGTAIGLGTEVDIDEAADNASTIGIVGGIVLFVVIFVAYFCGGYVAGRMARFDGVKQGIAVWLWALIIAIVVAVVGAIAGSQFDVLAGLNAFPRVPLNEGDLTVAGIVTLVLVVIASLVGAIVGGIAGMRFHRRVDRAGLGR